MESGKNKHDDWIAFQRIQEVKSAGQINIVRVAAVVLFFSILVFLYAGSEHSEQQSQYLGSSARVCGIWLLVAGLVYYAIRRRKFPPILKYASTFFDVVLLVTIAAAGAKAESTLVIVFFIISASTFLRLSTKLILFTTVLCICGYLGLVYVTDQFWTEPNFESFPVLQVLRTVAGLALMGLIGWQLCRGCRFGVESMLSYERLRGHGE